MTSPYSIKLKDPRWQKKRLKILERDGWACQLCDDSESTLVVHHRRYLPGTEPWDYPDHLLVTLCEDCHESERSERPECESELLEQLRERFFSSDIHSLMIGFHHLELPRSSDRTAAMLEWVLSSPEIQQELLDRYSLTLKAKHGKFELDRQ